jgi:hypothetical protein
MAKLLVFIIFCFISLLTYIVIKVRNRRNKNASKRYLRSLLTDGVDTIEVDAEVCMRVATMPLANVHHLKMVDTNLKTLGNARIRFVQKIHKNATFLVAETLDTDLTAYGSEQIFHMNRFVVKEDSTSNQLIISSDIHETLRSKLVKQEFARDLLELIEKGSCKSTLQDI